MPSDYHARTWNVANAANPILIIQNWMVRNSPYLNPFGQFTVTTLQKDWDADEEGVYKPMECPEIHWELDNDELSGEFRRALKRAFRDVGGLKAKGNPPFVRIEARKNFYVLMLNGSGPGEGSIAPGHFWWTERSVHPDSLREPRLVPPEREDYPIETSKNTRDHTEPAYPSAYRVEIYNPGGMYADNPDVYPLGRGLSGPRTSDVFSFKNTNAAWRKVFSLKVSVRNSFDCEYTCVPKKESGNLSELVRAEDEPLLRGFTEDEFKEHKKSV